MNKKRFGVRGVLCRAIIAAVACGGVMSQSNAEEPAALRGLDAMYPKLSALYTQLHQNPELSLCEKETSALLAARLRELGYEVTEKVGGYGVVAIFRNGTGPTVLMRADMDGLPIEEKTGVAYASKKRMLNHEGKEMPVMHACGHDVHMTSLVGAAELLMQCKSEWSGTLMLIGQPAEEGFAGAKAMIKDGLFDRFGKPDFCVGLHVDNRMPAGVVGVTSGPVFAASNTVDVTVFGVGGHGSMPHRTVDPIVIASRIVTTLQTIVSREVDPLDSAVVSVGTFHAGTKHNIIPEEATLGLTVRTYKPETKQRVLDAIARICKAEAAAAGAPKEPLIDLGLDSGYDVVINEPGLTERLAGMLESTLGKSLVMRMEPVMGGEDFGVFGSVAKVPSIQFRFGTVNEAFFADAKAKGRMMLIPTPHSPLFLPDQEPSIRAGVKIFTLSALELMDKAESKPAAK